MLKDYFSFAWKSLVHKKLRSWLTLLGIVIGVASVVALTGLGDALQAAVAAQFGISATEVITIQAGGLSAGPPGAGVVNPLTYDDVDDIESLPSIKYAFSKVLEEGDMVYGDNFKVGYATNIPGGQFRRLAYDIIDIDPAYGRWLKDSDVNKVVVGNNFIKDEEGHKPVKLGDSIEFKGKEFEIIGILEKKGSFTIDGVLFMNDDDIRETLDDKEETDFVIAIAKDSSVMDKAKEGIEKVLRKNRDVDLGEEDFSVETPEGMMDNVNNVLGGVQAFIIIIASISIIVGTIGIVNTMTTSVLERKNQIGIMKAIGARNSNIFFQFFIESGLMGLFGGIIGTLIGVMISTLGVFALKNMLNLDIMPSFNIPFITFVLIGAFVVGSVAGIAPAMSAAGQNPVDAIRDE